MEERMKIYEFQALQEDIHRHICTKIFRQPNKYLGFILKARYSAIKQVALTSEGRN